MALNMKPDAQETFFKAVFGDENIVVTTVKKLIADGVMFDIGMYTVKATWQGKVWQKELTKGTTSLMKKLVDPVLVEQNKNLIEEWLDQVHVAVAGDHAPFASKVPPVNLTYSVVINGIVSGNYKIPVIKAVRIITGMLLHEAKELVDQAQMGKAVVVKDGLMQVDAKNAFKKLEDAGALGYILDSTGAKLKVETYLPSSSPSASWLPKMDGIASGGEIDVAAEVAVPLVAHGVKKPKGKPAGQIVYLREAQALGQKVYGTSPGSVYYCVAYNDRVKIAARIYKKGTISIRAEWQNINMDEKLKLENAGLSLKGDKYASQHFQIGEIPAGRVIGAFLLGTEIKFTEIVTFAGDLVTEG